MFIDSVVTVDEIQVSCGNQCNVSRGHVESDLNHMVACAISVVLFSRSQHLTDMAVFVRSQKGTVILSPNVRGRPTKMFA